MSDRKFILPGESEPIEITDGNPEEFAELDKIKVEDPTTGGVEYEPWALRQAEWIERNFSDPGTLIDENVPFRFWQAVADHIKAQMRLIRSPLLRDSFESAYVWAQRLYKNKVNAMTPKRAQMDLHDMMVLISPTGRPDTEAMRVFRLACYRVFQKEYIGRQVG